MANIIIVKDEHFYTQDEVYWDFYKCPGCDSTQLAWHFKFCPNCGAKIEWDLTAEHIAEMEDKY